MKINNLIYWLAGLVFVASGCTINEFEGQNQPGGEYIRLSLSGGDGSVDPTGETRATWEDPNGKGNLGFKWENVDIDSDQTNELLMIVSNGTAALSNLETPQAGTPASTYTGLAVTPGADPHVANFETVRYYSTTDLSRAKFVYAVAGGATITTEGNTHICSLEMPSSFIQGEDQDPSFLRDHMFLYGTAEYNANSNTRLKFKHIPATFRFIITNGTDSDMTFQSISVGVVEGGAVASKNAEVVFDCVSNSAELSFGAEKYETVTTMLPDNGATVQKGNKYTTYALALPLAGNDAFAGKVISFTAKTSDGKNLTYLLDGATLANANGAGSGIYNWVGGKSYTIKFNIGDGGKTSGTLLSNKDINVVSTVGGFFTLKYVDASGNPLADYADICTLNVADMATYDDFIDANVAPYEADAIGIYDEADVKVGTIAINGIKADNSGLLYSVGMLSDVHLNTQNSYYSDSFTDFDNALKFFNAANVAFTCTCGDITENGIEAEFARYQEIVAANPATPVYTTTGNHDATQSGINEALWKQYTGNGLTYEVSKTVNGQTDHFLFLGMSVWNFSEAYTTANLMWLRSRLEAYKNERCFIITHLFFPEGAGNMLNIYPEGNWLRGVQLNELKELAAKYVNTIWFSGHSHWKWSLQKFDDDANVYRNQNAGWTVHIPSCAKPSDSNGIPGSGDAARQEKKDQSEGAVINVYENHIDVLGVDFISGKYIPVGTYRLDTTLEEVAETPLDETSLTADKFTWYKGMGEMSITDVEGMPGYIDVIFTGNGQGYYVKNSTFTEGHDSDNQVFDLDIEYLQCWTNWNGTTGTEVATIDKVGFYSGDYNLVNTIYCYVDPIHGVQFQTKSNCDAAFPIKLRMKARGEFYLKDENQVSQGVELTAADFIYNEGKNPGATITDVGGGYIEAIFTGTSQGFWMTNSTFTPGYGTEYQPVDIIISGLQCWTNWNEATGTGTEVATIDKVGFYSGSYNLVSTDKCYVDANYGVQFQTSSSCAGPFPIKIRMKATAYFNLSSSAPSLPSQPSPYISASDFAINPVKVNKNDDIATYVSDVEGMPGYVDVRFTAASQGFFITHSTHSSNTKKVDVVIEDAKALDKNGTEMTMPANVGFYGYLSGQAAQTYNMAQEMSFYNLPAEGVAFQTSSQCPGPYEFTVRMKVKTKFY